MRHANTKGGILAVRANAADPAKILSEMQTAFGQFKSDHKAEVRELQTGMDEMNQTMAALRVGSGAGDGSAGQSPRDKKEVNAALRKLIRDGDDSAMASLQSGINAGMSTDSNPDGGFSVVPFLSPVMTERLHAISPMRQLARTEVIATDVFEEIADTGEAGAEWVTEREARGDTVSPTLRKLSVPVHEISAMPKITQRLLDDSTFDLATWLTGHISQRFARKEGAAFINGDGVNKPRGILQYDVADADDDARAWGTIQTVASGKAAEIEADSMVDLVYSIKPEYRAGAVFLMNRRTAATVRKLKDGAGRFLWMESLIERQPALLLGFPVALDEEMPDVGAGNTPAVSAPPFVR
ncbi:MAG: phage major capsid protein [Loktanella sp.]|nr:phage major capsid protein [Loktanella sp.]